MGAPCFWLVFYLKNHYPRCTGALSYPFNPPRYSSFRWIRAKSCARYSLLKFSAKVVSERSRRKTGKRWHDDYDYDYDTRNAAILSLDGMGSDRERLPEWWTYRGSASAKFCKNSHVMGNPNSGNLTRNDEFMGKSLNS